INKLFDSRLRFRTLCGGLIFLHERGDLFWRRWQTCKYERQTANQRPRLGGICWNKSLLFELRQYEPIDGMLGPTGIPWQWGCGLLDRLQAPPVAAGAEDFFPGG